MNSVKRGIPRHARLGVKNVSLGWCGHKAFRNCCLGITLSLQKYVLPLIFTLQKTNWQLTAWPHSSSLYSLWNPLLRAHSGCGPEWIQMSDDQTSPCVVKVYLISSKQWPRWLGLMEWWIPWDDWAKSAVEPGTQLPDKCIDGINNNQRHSKVQLPTL